VKAQDNNMSIEELQYPLHPEIDRVSHQLFREGYYQKAVTDAYARVIEEVKTKSGMALAGDPLMNFALSCDRQAPMIQFNSLQTEEEREEQRGLTFLFRGIVELPKNQKLLATTFSMNPLAHTNIWHSQDC
jgi:uncharacterized protein (TIGR02391 family)